MSPFHLFESLSERKDYPWCGPSITTLKLSSQRKEYGVLLGLYSTTQVC